jgi:hypothetical protein
LKLISSENFLSEVRETSEQTAASEIESVQVEETTAEISVSQVEEMSVEIKEIKAESEVECHPTKDEIEEYEESQRKFHELWENKREKVSLTFSLFSLLSFYKYINIIPEQPLWKC